MTAPILVTRPVPDAGLEVLQAAGLAFDLRDAELPPSHDELCALLAGRTGVFCQLTDPFDAAAMDAAGAGLRVIATMSVGVNHIDLAAAAARGITVTNTPGVLTDATVECALALMFAAARRVVEGDAYTRAGRFTAWGPMLMLGAPIAGATLGIVGAGRIGATMARRCRGLGMEVCYHSRSAKPDLEADTGATRVALEELLQRSDVVSLHVPLTEETRYLLNRERLALMKPTAILVNTARGPVVEEQALIDALRAGRLRAAGLDVYEHEPELTPGLTELDNVVLLPHVGSATDATRARMAVMTATDIVAVLAGRPPAHPVSA
ncbi:MAG: 2-hydroxyacid dehydrogenase [Planctomycetota bacterium]|jgi:glyoxylate reductase